MRQKKTRLEMYSLYDHTGLSAHLEKMAARGWLLEKIGTWGWTYRRCEPMQVRFAVTYFPKASPYDPGPSDGELDFQAYCKEAGWILAASSAQLQIFYHPDPDCTPLETDALTQVENIHEAGKKTFLWTNYLFLALSIFEILILGVTRISSNPIELFTQTTIPFSLLLWLLLGILSVVELVTYYRWRKKALRLAEEEDRFLPTKSSPWLQKWLLIIVGVGYLLWITTLQNGKASYALVMLCAMAILIAAVNGVRLLMKKLGLSRTVNMTVTIIVDVVLAFTLIFGLTYWAMSSGFGQKEPVDTYEYLGRERPVYADPLPLYVDELLEIDHSDYSCEILQEHHGLFGWAYIAHQSGRNDRAKDLPGIWYYVVEIENDRAFEICWKERLEAYGGVLPEEDLTEPWSNGLVAQDPAPWQAEAVYRQYLDLNPRKNWLIRWENRLVWLQLDWEPTQEQMDTIVEKLSTFTP